MTLSGAWAGEVAGDHLGEGNERRRRRGSSLLAAWMPAQIAESSEAFLHAPVQPRVYGVCACVVKQQPSALCCATCCVVCCASIGVLCCAVVCHAGVHLCSTWT